MATFQNFRSALNGFNREDVVSYIELINNKHAAQVNQLKTELQTLQAELSKLRAAADTTQLQDLLDEEKARRAALEQELAQVRQELESKPQASTSSDSELEAYRRAERAERLANERVSQLYAQANGTLADATARVDEASTEIIRAADQAAAQLAQLQKALEDGKIVMRDAAAAMYAIRPVDKQN